jgi:hypothetical protein
MSAQASEETIRQYLERVRESDKAKGGDGLRTTREVAEYFGISMAAARRKGHAAWEAGEIEAFDGGASGVSGNPIFWGAKR